MDDSKPLAAALRLAASGQSEEAAGIFVKLLRESRETGVKLQAALGIVGTVNPIQDNELLLEACDKGLELANGLREIDARAVLLAKKAVCLSFEVSQFRYRRRMLALAPHWKAFSLETDRNEFDRLTKAIDNADREAHKLIDEALRLAIASGKKELQGHVLMMRGEFFGSKCLDLQLEHLREASKLRILKLLRLREYAFSKDVRQKVRDSLKESRKSYLEAATRFASLGDDSNRAMVLYNLANSLRSADRFREASQYLAETRIVARKLKDESLLRRVEALEERIRTRNRNVPDYVGGASPR